MHDIVFSLSESVARSSSIVLTKAAIVSAATQLRRFLTEKNCLTTFDLPQFSEQCSNRRILHTPLLMPNHWILTHHFESMATPSSSSPERAPVSSFSRRAPAQQLQDKSSVGDLSQFVCPIPSRTWSVRLDVTYNRAVTADNKAMLKAFPPRLGYLGKRIFLKLQWRLSARTDMARNSSERLRCCLQSLFTMPRSTMHLFL